MAAFALLLSACAVQEDVVQSQQLSETPLHGKFIWHDLVTDDVEAAKAFYGGLFGWTFVDTTRPGGGPYTLIIGDAERVLGGIVEVEDPADGDYSRWLGYISTADVDLAVRKAQDQAGRVVIAPRELGKVARAAVIEDAQGAVVGLIDSHIGDPDDQVAVRPGDVAWNELLASNDLAAAKFYMETAGYQVQTEQRDGGEYHLLKRNGVARAGLQAVPDQRVDPLWLTHFAVEDPAAGAQRAASLGGTVILAPSPDVRDGELALVTDPGGAVLALKRLAF